MNDEKMKCHIGKHILVTGASGYLASSIINQLKDLDCRITRLTRGRRELEPVTGKADIVDMAGDIRSIDVWEDALKQIDIVYHLAAQTSVYSAEKDPGFDLEINVKPMLNLLETCRRNDWHPSIVFAGTATEVGISERLPVNETQEDKPITIYDIHKLMAETYLKHFTREKIVRGAVLRLANVYGPGPASSNSDRGIINLMMRKALAGEELTIYGTGNYLRDYVYIEDVAEAFMCAVLHMDRIIGKHFVIGSGRGHTFAEAIHLVADSVARKTGKSIRVSHLEPPSTLHAIEFRNFVADSKAFTDATGWTPKYELSEGILRTIDT